ncbi:MAG: substrate-binding domain-containing protein [Arenimonas sp.]|nr:substrate-binding domain-containing protein [Rhizobium sp.]MBW8446299.1 substrate-binding domain-containing protein [Arenimonas sp.]
MRRPRPNLILIPLLLAGLLTGEPAVAQTLRLGGTGGAMPMAEHLAEAYAAQGGPTFEIVPDLGSSGAIRAAGDGVIDLAISSRELKTEELARGLKSAPLARTPLVLITSHRSPGAIKSVDLPGLFASENPTWPDGSPVRLILRPKSETDTAIFIAQFPGMAEALDAARQRPEIPVAATDQDNASAAEDLPGSLVQSGLSQIVTEKRNVRLVAIDGVEPTLENLEKGVYPYEKRYYLVYADKTATAAQGLLAFLRSEQGRLSLRETGSLTVAE